MEEGTQTRGNRLNFSSLLYADDHRFGYNPICGHFYVSYLNELHTEYLADRPNFTNFVIQTT